MTVAPYTPEIYPTLLPWWERHGVPAVPSHCLPKLGVVVANDSGENILAAWASMDNSTGLAFLLWPTGNPDTPARLIHTALRHATAYLIETLRAFGYHTLLAATHSTSVARQWKQYGFTPDTRPLHLHSFSL